MRSFSFVSSPNSYRMWNSIAKSPDLLLSLPVGLRNSDLTGSTLSCVFLVSGFIVPMSDQTY